MNRIESETLENISEFFRATDPENGICYFDAALSQKTEQYVVEACRAGACRVRIGKIDSLAKAMKWPKRDDFEFAVHNRDGSLLAFIGYKTKHKGEKDRDYFESVLRWEFSPEESERLRIYSMQEILANDEDLEP